MPPALPRALAALLPLALAPAACHRAPPFPAAPVALHPGLSYREVACRVSGHDLRLRQLRASAAAGVQLRAVLNPTARTSEQCSQRYGGNDLRAVLASVPGFTVLGATNGNFFHRLGQGFRSNGMIWSLAGGDARGALLAPVQPSTNPDFRGDRVFVADARGGHEVRIATGDCEPGSCRVRVSPGTGTPPDAAEALRRYPDALPEGEFVGALREAFPTMTLAMQVNPGYADRPEGSAESAGSAGQELAESFRCSPERAWLCRPHPVTVLCAGAGGEVSLLTAEEVSYPDLVPALRPGGACGVGCERMYILDGGGSAQIAIREGTSGRFSVRFAGKSYADPPAGCADFRPVDHYLVAGTPSGP